MHTFFSQCICDRRACVCVCVCVFVWLSVCFAPGLQFALLYRLHMALGAHLFSAEPKGKQPATIAPDPFYPAHLLLLYRHPGRSFRFPDPRTDHLYLISRRSCRACACLMVVIVGVLTQFPLRFHFGIMCFFFLYIWIGRVALGRKRVSFEARTK